MIMINEVDLAVGVVDDGKEHVEEDEEDKEDVGEEEDGAENTICLANLFRDSAII